MLKKAAKACRSILLDESGQTMLEYIVIVIFVVIAAIVAWKVIKYIVGEGTRRASSNILGG